MKLIDMEVTKYLDVLKSDAPAPGGGSVSALAGAQGVGLFMYFHMCSKSHCLWT